MSTKRLMDFNHFRNICHQVVKAEQGSPIGRLKEKYGLKGFCAPTFTLLEGNKGTVSLDNMAKDAEKLMELGYDSAQKVRSLGFWVEYFNNRKERKEAKVPTRDVCVHVRLPHYAKQSRDGLRNMSIVNLAALGGDDASIIASSTKRVGLVLHKERSIEAALQCWYDEKIALENNWGIKLNELIVQ